MKLNYPYTTARATILQASKSLMFPSSVIFTRLIYAVAEIVLVFLFSRITTTYRRSTAQRTLPRTLAVSTEKAAQAMSTRGNVFILN